MYPVLFPVKRGDFPSGVGGASPSAFAIEPRFWTHVTKTETCWEWHGRMHDKGYGQMEFIIQKSKPGKKNRRKAVVRAHRISWLLFRGEIPSGLHVLHACDNRKCVRPEHLFLGTEKDNHDDAMNKNRKPQCVYHEGNRKRPNRPKRKR